MRIPLTLALLLYTGSVTAQAASDPAPAPLNIYQLVTGTEVVHVVVQGETLGHIAGRFGMSTRLAAVVNHLADPGKLHLGQRLVLSNRHIVPNEPIKLARLEGDKVLLEAHPSASSQLVADFLQGLHESEVAEIIDFAAAQRVIHDAWGIAIDVSSKKTGPSPESARADVADRP